MELSASTSKTNIYTRPLLLSTWQTPFLFFLVTKTRPLCMYLSLTNKMSIILQKVSLTRRRCQVCR